MSFDPTMRRLITATRDGSINLWNFNNGGCLRSIEVLLVFRFVLFSVLSYMFRSCIFLPIYLILEVRFSTSPLKSFYQQIRSLLVCYINQWCHSTSWNAEHTEKVRTAEANT